MEGMKNTSTLKEYPYRRHPPEGKEILILAKLSEIPDGPPEGEDISLAVRVLCMGRAGGPSEMRSEHLKGCIREETR